MKPRINLAETDLPDGSTLTLQEHDGRKSLLIHGQQICGAGTRAAEEELAKLACAPFRPARQPKIFLVGLGLGQTLKTVCEELKAKRGTFVVAEPTAAITQWHREFIPESPIHHDPRVVLENDCGPPALEALENSLHAILLHLDASPMGPRNRPWVDDRRWLAAAYDSLQPGGLLAIAGSRRIGNIHKSLKKAGFDVAEYDIPASPNAKRSRLMPIWLGRKGRPID